MIVDGLEGEGELVIKAVDDQTMATDLVSGASILGDGRVVLILNMVALMERFTKGRTNGAGTSVADCCRPPQMRAREMPLDPAMPEREGWRRGASRDQEAIMIRSRS